MTVLISLSVNRRSIYKKRLLYFAGRRNCARASTSGRESDILKIIQK